MGRTFGVVAVLLLVACGVPGGGPSGGNAADFTGHWVLSGGPIVSCPSGTGVLSAIDGFDIAAGTDFPLVLSLKKSAPLCDLDFSLTNGEATLAPGQTCTLPFDVAPAVVTFTSGELGGTSAGNHLNISLKGSVPIKSESCSYSIGVVGTK